MIWLPNPVDRRQIYALSYAQSVARLTNICVLYYTRKVNPYDTSLNMFLLVGAELTGSFIPSNVQRTFIDSLTIAMIGAAPGLEIVGHKWGVGILKPFGVLVGCLSIALVSAGFRPDAFKAELDKVDLLNTKLFGNQPACEFPPHFELLIPLLIASVAIMLGELCPMATATSLLTDGEGVVLAHLDFFHEMLLNLGKIFGDMYAIAISAFEFSYVNVFLSVMTMAVCVGSGLW